MSERADVTNNIDLLLEALPVHITAAIQASTLDPDDLLEIVMDLGRLPEARYRNEERFLSDREVTQDEIDYVIERIGVFGEDNRAGIPRTLHRISAIRNRRGTVIGLTCRVGRAIFGTVTIIRDLVETGKSILLLGKPGTGKTTLLRETARVLAEEFRKRVVIVDTSNEIAGDGDIPHPGIGRARRMQVPRPAEQHAVMIEAVENHMPEVIVIDEIGTELEAMAARTIAERGVQLVGTAHGNTLDNLMINPTLSDLVGGIQAVTLGDEEARRRGTQKTVLERKAPPTFDILIEIESWDSVTVYDDVAAAVDAILRGEDPPAELRSRDADGVVHVETVQRELINAPALGRRILPTRGGGERGASSGSGSERFAGPRRERGAAASSANGPTQRIFPFGVSRNRLETAIERLRVPAVIVRDMKDATLVMTLKNYYRQSAQRLKQAEEHGVPVYVLRNNTITQMERQLAQVFNLRLAEEDERGEGENRRSNGSEVIEDAMVELENAINQVMSGERNAVELAPRSSYIRRLQHQMADRYNLRSESRGDDPNRRVKIYR
ncbi:single-stranded nucleic acid binding R3H domain-containing protein [Oscillochloris trichoides DG-6]|uniref:Single-stranded nucleic acid binding R3H domain-containing protein n=1 Tax=Oscillochloris trichoides DG-6 TaxID=765420 RepID=E1IGX6_9CHLR|nr:R3H domain-containing nucleic acid-binding protein [Oscillochloris trichoides]EFO79451.1 single-stranded nucleic acid binding R3H domain-containing protein [Oscillochloris trichoides DG-6]